MFMLISNEPITVASKISRSINVEWRTFDRNGNNSFSESKKNFGRLIDHISERGGVGFKPVTKTLYWSKFLVISECIFKLVCHCRSCRLSDIGCA